MAKNVLAKMLIDGEIQDIMVKTGADNVIVDKDTGELLSTRLAKMVTDISSTITPSEVDTKISTAIDNLIDGAPSTYDTLKEIADYIANDETAKQAIEDAIAKKVDKVDGKGLSANDFTDALLTKLNGIAEGATKVATSSTNGSVSVNGSDVVVYTHPTTSGNKHIPSGGSDGQVLGYSADGTAKWVTPTVAIQSGTTAPTSVDSGVLYLQILD
jgi:hypothetical protein